MFFEEPFAKFSPAEKSIESRVGVNDCVEEVQKKGNLGFFFRRTQAGEAQDFGPQIAVEGEVKKLEVESLDGGPVTVEVWVDCDEGRLFGPAATLTRRAALLPNSDVAASPTSVSPAGAFEVVGLVRWRGAQVSMIVDADPEACVGGASASSTGVSPASLVAKCSVSATAEAGAKQLNVTVVVSDVLVSDAERRTYDPQISVTTSESTVTTETTVPPIDESQAPAAQPASLPESDRVRHRNVVDMSSLEFS
jgi:hypothetical protein